MNERKKVRFGIAGCGMIADYHVKAILDTAGAEPVGACSKTPAHAKNFTEKYEMHFYENYEQMLSSDAIDMVVLCTPSGDHYPMAVQALRAGKGVVIEKPMCLKIEDADNLIKLARETGLTVCAVSQSRFWDSSQAIYNASRQGLFGKPVSALLTMRYTRPQSYYDQAEWRGTIKGDGGGILMNQGIHGIDLLCYIMGEPESVCGYVRTALRNIEVEDTAVASVKFKSGAIAAIDATVCSNPPFTKKFIFCWEKGTAILEDDALTLWSFDIPCPVPLGNFTGNSSAADPRGIHHKYHAREYANLVAHELRGEKLVIDAVQGKLPLSLILGIYQSSAEGRLVEF